MLNPLRQKSAGTPAAPSFAPSPGGAPMAPAMPKPAAPVDDASACKQAIRLLATAVASGQTQGIDQQVESILGPTDAGAAPESSDAGLADDGTGGGDGY